MIAGRSASAAHDVDSILGIETRQTAGLRECIQHVIAIRRQQDRSANTPLIIMADLSRPKTLVCW